MEEVLGLQCRLASVGLQASNGRPAATAAPASSRSPSGAPARYGAVGTKVQTKVKDAFTQIITSFNTDHLAATGRNCPYHGYPRLPRPLA